MPPNTFLWVMGLAALIGLMVGLLILNAVHDRLSSRAERAEQQLQVVRSLMNRASNLAGALDEAALLAQREMLREVVAARGRQSS